LKNLDRWEGRSLRPLPQRALQSPFYIRKNFKKKITFHNSPIYFVRQS